MDFVRALESKRTATLAEANELRETLATVERRLLLIEELLALETKRRPVERSRRAPSETRSDPETCETPQVAAKPMHADEAKAEDAAALARAEKGRRRQQIVDACAKVIAEAGKPLRQGALVRGLQEQGIEIPSDAPGPYLASLLAKSQGSVINIPGQGYWPASLPPPRGAQTAA